MPLPPYVVPNCTTGWEWSYNSLNQTPCEISGALQASCRGVTPYNIPTLPPSGSAENYAGPMAGDTASLYCECNTVLYSLYMGCTVCQTRPVLFSWSTWAQNCPSSYILIGDFATQIPSDTIVPHWAYLNATGSWNETAARLDALNSNVTSITTSSTTSSSTSPPTSLSSLSSSFSSAHFTSLSTPRSSSTSTSSSSAGAIAGGIVGGLAFFAIVGAIIWYLVGRKSRSVADELEEHQESEPMAPAFNNPHMKLYSPDDPSTYPVAFSGGTYSSDTENTALDNLRGTYTGVPEVQ